MKTLLILMLCVTVGCAESFTNKTKSGLIITTTTIHKRYTRAPSPPMPPGLSVVVKAPKARQTTNMAQGASIQSRLAIPIEKYRSTNAHWRTIVGALPKFKARTMFSRERAVRLAPESTGGGPEVFITSQSNVPVIYPDYNPPYYVVIPSQVTKVSTVQLARFNCRIEYTTDFVTWNVAGEFEATAEDQMVGIQWITQMQYTLPNVFWRSVNYDP